MLTVFIDFKSPASFLALEPTLALAQETGVQRHPFALCQGSGAGYAFFKDAGGQ